MSELSPEAFLESFPPEIAEIALLARSKILSLIPDAIEMVDPPSKIIGYGFGRKYSQLICAIAPQAKHVNLMFSEGADLPDPTGLLEGTGKRARHVKLRQAADLEAEGLDQLLEEAARRKR